MIPSDVQWRVQIRQALTQMALSKDAPLSFHVPYIMKDGQDLLQALFEQCHRWKFAHLPCTSNLVRIKTPCPSLPRLEALFFTGHLFPPPLPPLEHKYYPRLRSLLLGGDEDVISFPSTIATSPLITQLTHLVLQKCWNDSVFPILRVCAPSLRILELYNIDSNYNPTSEVITFPKLARLSLHRIWRNLVNNLDCPQLKELTVHGMEFDYGESSLPSSITSAKLMWPNHPTDVFGLIEVANRLTRLNIQVQWICNVPCRFYEVDHLFVLLAEPTTCPHLEHISIQLEPHERAACHIAAFISFVRSRAAKLSYASLSTTELITAERPHYLPEFGVHNETVLDEHKRDIQKLRVDYPRLDLHVFYRFEKKDEAGRRIETVDQVW